MPNAKPRARRALKPVEKVDIDLAQAVALEEDSAAGRLVGKFAELGDQPPMQLLCGATIAAGAARGDRRLFRAGLRMLAAHSLATGLKSFVKHRVDRTRPSVLVEEGRYDMGAGTSREHDYTSFPSGHTAGAVAAAAAYAHVYPEHRAAAYAAAGAVALMQIPRCKHYPSDVGAGAAIGLAAAGAAGAAGNGIAAMLSQEEENWPPRGGW